MTRHHVGTDASLLEVAPAGEPPIGRRRQRGGMHRAAARPQLPALGVCPTPDVVTAAALRLLAAEQALADMIRVFHAVAEVDPHARAWLEQSNTLKRRTRAELTALGFGPSGTLDAEDRVEIAGRVYRLPDQFDATVRDLLHLTLATTATTTRQETVTMHTTTTDPNPALNGSAAPAEASVLNRALAVARNALPTLRLPTLTEALVGAALVVVLGGVYAACTSEVPTTDV